MVSAQGCLLTVLLLALHKHLNEQYGLTDKYVPLFSYLPLFHGFRLWKNVFKVTFCTKILENSG